MPDHHPGFFAEPRDIRNQTTTFMLKGLLTIFRPTRGRVLRAVVRLVKSLTRWLPVVSSMASVWLFISF
jgi:hypothetical protein